MKKILLLTFVYILLGQTVYSATITSNAVTGNWSSTSSWSGGVLPGVNDSVVIVNGGNITLNANAAIYKLTINTGGILNCSDKTLTLGGNGILGGNFNIYGTLNLNSGTVLMTGNFYCNGTFNSGTGSFDFNGNDAQTIGGTTAPVFYNLTTSNTNGAVGKGLSGHPVNTTIKGNFNANGVFARNSQGFPTATVTFDGNTILGGAYSFYLNHVVINSGATVNAGAKTIYLYGNFTCNGTFVCGTSTINVKYDTYSSCQPNNQKIYIDNYATNMLYNLTISKTSGSVGTESIGTNTYGNLYVQNNFTVESGTWDVNGVRRLYVRGNFLVNTGATFIASSGRLLMEGSSSSIPQSLGTSGNSLYKLTIDNHGAGVKLTSNLTVTFEMVLTDGLLKTKNGAVSYEAYVSNPDPVSIPVGYSDTSYVAGNLRRAINSGASTYVFPVGAISSINSFYRPVTLNLTSAGGAGNILMAIDSTSNAGTYYANWWAKLIPNTGVPVGTALFNYKYPADFQAGMNECAVAVMRGTAPPTASWDYVLQTSVPASGGNNGTITANLPAVYSPYAFMLGEPVPLASDVTQCDGNSASLNVTSPSGYGTFNWYNAPSGGSTLVTSSTTYTTPVLNDTTTYYVAWVNPQCAGHRYPVTVNSNNIPTSAFVSVDPACHNSTGTLTYTGTAGSSATYTWNSGGSTLSPGTGQGPHTVSGTPGQNYTLGLTVSENGCSSGLSTTTVEIPVLLSLSMNSTNSACGNNNGTAGVSPSGGWGSYTYLWSNLATSATLTGLAPGSYTVTVTDAGGCTKTGTVSISDIGAPIVNSSVNQNISCFGLHDGSATLTASGTGTLTYTWSNGITGNNPGSINLTVDTLSASSYQITVTDGNGCNSVNSLTLTEPNPLNLTETLQNPGCYGYTNGTISVSASGGTVSGTYDYDWLHGSTQSNLINMGAGNYTVTVTDDNGCTLSESYSLINPDSLHITPIVSPISCFGESDGTIQIVINGGTLPYDVSWSNGDTTTTISGLSNATYYAVVTDDHGCTAIHTEILNQPTPISSPLTASPVICAGESSGSVDLTVSGGTSPYGFEWSNGATTEDISALPAGQYWVTVTDNNGCTGIASTGVNEPNPLVVTTSAADVSCFGSSNGLVQVFVSGGVPVYSIEWSQGDTTALVSNLSAGTYAVTITDSNGCTSLQTIVLSEPAQLDLTSTTTNAICFGESTGGINISPTGGVLAYTYAWSDGSSYQDLSSVPAGSYGITITDNNGCQLVRSITVGENPELSISLSFDSMLCSTDSSGQVFTSVTGGSGTYSYFWSNAVITPNQTGLTSGIYYLTVTDALSCTSTDTLLITEAPPVSAEITLIQTNQTAEVIITGGTGPFDYLWSTGSTTDILSPLPAVQFMVTITDANGCTASDTSETLISLLIPDAITPNADGKNDQWEIQGIAAFGEISLRVYSRWGDLIFSFDGTGIEYSSSTSRWDGTLSGEKLPMGAYLYIVDLKNGEEPFTGTVSIIY